MIEKDYIIAFKLVSKIFDKNSVQFYQIFGYTWYEQRGESLSKQEIENNYNRKWYETICQGSKIDYFINNRWRYGTVTKMETVNNNNNNDNDENDKQQQQTTLHILRPRNEVHTRVVRSVLPEQIDKIIYAQECIAPGLTKSIEKLPHMVKFRRELRTGMKCDALDTVHKWYLCTVVDVSLGTNSVLLRSDGWSARYDEWYNRDDPRIQPPLTVATGGKESGGVKGTWGAEDLEPIIEDCEDPNDENIYAVWRVK